ncbi:MAG: hypothetical protein MPJ78_18430 [Hyphomicrobiaceae bacterium]|nr:hypothetical protein [Hyphomicrobiaceae bacterium]
MKIYRRKVWMFVGIMLAAAGLTFDGVKAADSPIVSTWKGGIHVLPASATRSGAVEKPAFKDGETVKQWRTRLTRELVKPDAKVPAVIYAHGCKGPTAATAWAGLFNEFGFAVFAPDSFERPGRKQLCYRKGTAWKVPMRQEEIRFALQQVRKLPWIDQDRVVLVGKSEGGRAVAEYKSGGFIAQIILAYDCKHKRRRPLAPKGVPVLNLVGANDRREKLCRIKRKAGGSKAISLAGQRHSFEGDPNAKAAIATFLSACCGYKPENATDGLDADETAKTFIEEYGDMARLVATMNADKALAKGDKKGQAFWLQVNKIASKLTGK